jgi:hypothetical protein
VDVEEAKRLEIIGRHVPCPLRSLKAKTRGKYVSAPLVYPINTADYWKMWEVR